MAIEIHPHARERMKERGATEEVTSTVRDGERFSARFGRVGFRRNFACGARRKGKRYKTKQIEVFGVKEHGDFIVGTVPVKY